MVKLLSREPVLDVVAAVSDVLDAAVVLNAMTKPVDIFVSCSSFHFFCESFLSLLDLHS